LKNFLRNPLFRAFGATVIAAAFMVVLDLVFRQGGWFWETYYTEPETLDYFCEQSIPGALFRHKVNTYTNLAYFWAALWMIFSGLQDRRRGGKTYLRRHWEWSILMGVACLLVFAGSTLFHAGLTRWTEWVDLAGVYAVALSIAFLNLHRLQGLFVRRHTSAWPFILAYGLAWAGACATIFELRSWYLVVGAFLLIALGGLAILLRTQRNGAAWWYLLSMACTVAAVMFFAFDISRVACDPKGWIQPHGNWHIFAALSFMVYYRFIRSSTATHAAL
jgi:hypothetical protein